MHKTAEEFRSSLKDTWVEEAMDLAIFRPIAFFIVKLILPLPITPNQLSTLSILAGIGSGVLFAFGTRTSFIYGGILFGLAHTLDCCDGMVARLKKNGTLIGRIVDGFADYITSIAAFVGLNIGIYNAGFDYHLPPWVLVALSGICMIVHCVAVDYYKSEFLAHALGKVNSTQQEKKVFSKEFARLKKNKGKHFDKFMIWIYLWYSRLQLIRNNKHAAYDPQEYFKHNKQLLRLWTWIGVSSHIFALMVAAFLYKPEVFFYYSLVGANLWMAVLLFVQIRTNKKIARSSGK